MNPPSASTNGTVGSEKGSKSDTHLHGRWLNLARCIWAVLVVLALGLFVASIPTYYASLHMLNASSPPSVGGQLTPHDAQTLAAVALTVDFYAWYNVLNAIVLECVFLAVGLLIFLRKSDDRMALLASFTLIMFPFSFSSSSLSTVPQSWLLAIRTVSFLSNLSLYLFFYLFPDGRFVPPWTRWLVLGMVAFEVVNIFFPPLPYSQCGGRASLSLSARVYFSTTSADQVGRIWSIGSDNRLAYQHSCPFSYLAAFLPFGSSPYPFHLNYPYY